MKILSRFLSLNGILIMLSLIIFTVPLTIPKLFGIQIYAVLSGSMEPEYPVGSIVYVEPVTPEVIQVGDVITFHLPEEADVVMTHRVTKIDQVAGIFITKGDANTEEDAESVEYDRLIGKAVFNIPKLAVVSDLINTTNGKLIIFSMFALSFILWIIADLILQINKKIPEVSNSTRETSGSRLSGRGLLRRGLLRIGFILLILVSAFGLISSMMEYDEAKKEYIILQESVNETVTDKENQQQEEEIAFRPNESIINEFQNLKSQNTDMMAWIAFDTLDISYPVMKGQDNLYYLTHTFSGKTNTSGSIFMEVGNAGDFSDCHTLIYGHNMKNGAMFGHLKKYREEEFYKGNEYFTVYLEDKYLRYQIFSVHTVSVTDPVYTIGFAPNEEFADFVDRLNRQAWYDTGIKANVNSKVVTLSTCTSSDDSRYVVHALLIEETEYQ